MRVGGGLTTAGCGRRYGLQFSLLKLCSYYFGVIICQVTAYHLNAIYQLLWQMPRFPEAAQPAAMLRYWSRMLLCRWTTSSLTASLSSLWVREHAPCWEPAQGHVPRLHATPLQQSAAVS